MKCPLCHEQIDSRDEGEVFRPHRGARLVHVACWQKADDLDDEWTKIDAALASFFGDPAAPVENP